MRGFFLAEISAAQNNPDKALDYYLKAINQQGGNPRKGEIHFKVARIHQSRNDFKSAIKHYKNSLNYLPDVAETCYELGVLNYKTGATETAEKYFKQAVKINPDYPAANNDLGILLRGKGLAREAEKYIRKALQLAPDNVDIMQLVFRNRIKLMRRFNNIKKLFLVMKGIQAVNLMTPGTDDGILRRSTIWAG